MLIGKWSSSEDLILNAAFLQGTKVNLFTRENSLPICHWFSGWCLRLSLHVRTTFCSITQPIVGKHEHEARLAPDQWCQTQAYSNYLFVELDEHILVCYTHDIFSFDTQMTHPATFPKVISCVTCGWRRPRDGNIWVFHRGTSLPLLGGACFQLVVYCQTFLPMPETQQKHSRFLAVFPNSFSAYLFPFLPPSFSALTSCLIPLGHKS